MRDQRDDGPKDASFRSEGLLDAPPSDDFDHKRTDEVGDPPLVHFLPTFSLAFLRPDSSTSALTESDNELTT